MQINYFIAIHILKTTNYIRQIGFYQIMAMPIKLKKELRKYLAYAAIVIGLLLILYLVNISIVSVITIIILMAVAAFSKVYKRVTSLSIGFELVTPVIIILGYKIGILFAILAGIFMLIASEFISGRLIPSKLIFDIIAYVTIAIIAGIGSGYSFVPLAIGLIIFRNLFVFITGIMIAGMDPFKMFLGTVPNIFINSFIIANIGMFLINLV